MSKETKLEYALLHSHKNEMISFREGASGIF